MGRRLTTELVGSLLSNIEPTKEFYLKDGRIVKNLIELFDAILDMDESTFRYHRNNEKNDFYNWIMHVVCDVRLANDIARAKTKTTTLRRIKERIDYLKAIEENNLCYASNNN